MALAMAVLPWLPVVDAQPTTPEATPTPITVSVVHLNDVYEILPVEGGKSGGLARVSRTASTTAVHDAIPASASTFAFGLAKPERRRRWATSPRWKSATRSTVRPTCERSVRRSRAAEVGVGRPR